MGRVVAAVRQRTLGCQPQLGDHVQALWAGYKPVTKADQQLIDGCLFSPSYFTHLRLPLISVAPTSEHLLWYMRVACTLCL